MDVCSHKAWERAQCFCLFIILQIRMRSRLIVPKIKVVWDVNCIYIFFLYFRITFCWNICQNSLLKTHYSSRNMRFKLEICWQRKYHSKTKRGRFRIYHFCLLKVLSKFTANPYLWQLLLSHHWKCWGLELTL